MTRKQRGQDAEQIALIYEQERLLGQGNKLVKYVGDRYGMGFDIQSVNSVNDPTPRFIEVKSCSKGRAQFFMSERERLNLTALGPTAWVYLVDVDQKRVVETIQNPMVHGQLDLRPMLHKIQRGGSR